MNPEFMLLVFTIIGINEILMAEKGLTNKIDLSFL